MTLWVEGAEKIVERHHGRIEVESTIGVGNLFRLVLPLIGRLFLDGIRVKVCDLFMGSRSQDKKAS